MNKPDFVWAPQQSNIPVEQMGMDAYRLIEKLYPICRSITGDGVRETLKLVNNEIDLEINEVPTGTEVFDWTIPDEWNIRDAYIENMQGERLVDFKDSNLHVVNYSEAVDCIVSHGELNQHLHSIEEHPDWIPYRTSYYHKTWGFCVSENLRRTLNDNQYRVYIDSTLESGNLTYGEIFLPGQSDDEFLIFTHICHPSLCNDNLSGISIATQLAKELSSRELNNSYRIVFAPATIGSITWLSQNTDKLENVKAGLVIAVAGDSGPMTFKKSKVDDSYINKIVLNVLEFREQEYHVTEFSPYGYDERQFSSPGINLPVGSLMRTPNGCFPEYHTSADNLDFVKPEYLADSIDAYLDVINVFDNNLRFKNLYPHGEPQLGKRELYRKTGGLKDIESSIMAKLWVLNFSDGEHDLLDISSRSRLNFKDIQNASKELYEAELLELIQA